MTKRSNKTSPNTPGSKVGELVKDNSPAEVKELSFEDTAIQFRNVESKWRISLRALAEYYDIQFAHAVAKITKNQELFCDLSTDRVTRSINGSASDYELSIRDAVSFLTLLNYKRYNDERRGKLIRMRNWLSDTAEKVLTSQIPTNPSEFDIGSFDLSNKGMSSLNGIRIRLQGMLAKQRHPSNPNTVKRKIDMFRRDHHVLKGHDDMGENWRQKEPEEGKIKLTGWVACGIYSFARGHLEPDEQSRDIKEFYATCPDLLPDHLPDMIETTRQTKLLGDES